ncbi:MAG: tetratricopeptide repeat protein [Cytophagales bacterium]|nr:tetratricopeptide repeat protein [Cytophagales bacterium]
MFRLFTVRAWLIGFGLAWTTVQASAQARLTVRETAEITYQARNVVSELEQLLNFVAFADNAPNEVAEVLARSYTVDARNQLFYNKSVIIEDDTDPENRPGRTADLAVDKYLQTLDVYYAKSVDPSVTFSNVRVSNVKKKDYFYVKVVFDCRFGNKHTRKAAPYPMRTRQATVRAEKTGNRWKAFISAVGFYDPAKPYDANDNNVAVTDETPEPVAAGNKTVAEQESAVRAEVDQMASARAEEERRAKETAYNEAIRLANAALENNDSQAALDAYHKAVEYNPFAPLPRLQIQKIERENKNRLDNLMQSAMRLQQSRRYDESLVAYRKVLETQPEAAGRVRPQIALLTDRISELLPLRNQYEARKYDAAIETCDELIKQKAKQKTIGEYPDLYWWRAKCYLKSNQRNATEKALRDFAEAIRLEPGYLDAYLTRAEFYESQREWDRAITDYDIITTKIQPDEARYYLKKAQIKEQMGLTRQAVADYDKALSLAPGNPLYHLQKGLLERRNGDRQAAVTSFTRALELNVTYTEAYLQRGSTLAELDKTNEAAADFRQVQKLGGSDSTTVRFVRAKSQDYHNMGAAALRNRDTPKAERLFDLALALDPRNGSVWITRGDVLFDRKEYLKALDLYNQAVQTNPRISEGFYKKALALVQLQRSKEALENLAVALRLNSTYLDAYVLRGDMLMAANQLTQALANYQQLADILLPVYKEQQRKMRVDASLKKQLSELYAQMAKCQNRMEMPPNALVTADQALTIDPTCAEAYYQRGVAYRVQKNHAGASTAFEQAAKYQPSKLAYQYALAQAAVQAGKYQDALAACNKTMELDNAQSLRDVRYLRGRSFYHLNRPAEALRDFTMHELKNPGTGDATFLAYFALAQLREKQSLSAAKTARKALYIEAKNPLALLAMGCVLAQQNKTQEAMTWLRKAFSSRQLDITALRHEEDLLRPVRTGTATSRSYADLRRAYFPGML